MRQRTGKRIRRAGAGLLTALICGVCAAAPQAAAAWTPEAASYGVGTTKNVTITAADGTKLFANVYYPTDKNGRAAAGPFPVLLKQTPYGKDDGAAGGLGAALGAGEDDYLIQRGYIEIITDVRGTGTSEGEWGLFDPAQGTDGAAWVAYAAHVARGDGDVGLLGPSYMGINQFATAADSGGPGHNPVKAMFPVIAANDVYRDTAFAGGFPDIEFDAIYLSLTGMLNTTLPFAEGGGDLPTAESEHIRDLADFDAKTLANVESGGDEAFDGGYWQQRAPAGDIATIVKDGIPAFLIGGWYDLFLRGEMMNYSWLQNAYEGRPLDAPMAPTEPTTPRYQLLMGPWYHVTTGSGLHYHGLDMNGIELAWFDHWLKGIDTGITDTGSSMHLEDLADGSYHEASRYPLDQATPTTYYLQPGGGLSPNRPAADGGSDPLIWDGLQAACDSSSNQWSMGVVALIWSSAGESGTPCTSVANLSQIGPGSQNYTTAPFTTATTLAGPIGASLYASTTTRDAEWVVQLSDVAPDGKATSLTEGLLDGEDRAVDSGQSWYAPDGNPLAPYHPYTAAAQQAITPGHQTRFDVEIFPTDDTLEPGHRLRVTISTVDFPHVLPTAVQLPNLIGGVYTLDHDAAGPSSVELPLLASGRSLPATPSTQLGCPAAAGSLSSGALGAARLGMSRAATRAALIDSSESTHGTKRLQYYCLAGAGMRVGFSTGRASLLLSENSHYSVGGLTHGSRYSAGGGYRIGANTWYVRGGRYLLKVRGGVVQEVGVTQPSRVKTAKAAKRFLKSF